MAFGRQDRASWEAILGAASKGGVVLDSPLLIEALRSAADPMRGEAAWYLAKTYCSRPPSNANEFLEALTSEGAAAREGGDPESRFGAELLRRVLGGAAVEDAAWIACLTTDPECHLDSDFGESPLFDYLTPGEKEAILRRNEANRPPEARSASGKRPKPPPPGGDMRLVTGLPEGTVRDLFQITGCESNAKTRWSSLAMVGFRPDGLPRRVALGGVPPGSACRQTAEALFLLTQAPEDADLGPDNRFTYVVLFDPDSVVCSEETTEPEGADRAVRRVRAHVVAPRLQKKVEPVYPESSRKAGEEGSSIFEAVIGREGCVRDLRLIQSSAPVLDLSGMEAISHWKYGPATLDGKPVRVYLTVTVTYALNSRSTRKP
jgi:TonB family protein